MARTLERLQQQYNSTAKGPGGPGGRGPGRGPGPGMRGGHGKPKNARATIARMLSYVGKYKAYLLLVLLCMILQTVASLCGSYLLAPIIDRITLAVNPAAVAAPVAEAVPVEPGPAKAQVTEPELVTVRALGLASAATTALTGMLPATAISRRRVARRATSPQRQPARQPATCSARLCPSRWALQPLQRRLQRSPTSVNARPGANTAGR